ncbi:MAG: ATP-binding protein [Kiritimatiellaeota bacterium]|nr:ATP-binding protein [Kiritimatiellota bacterium]
MMEHSAKLENLHYFVEEAGKLALEAGLSPTEATRVELCVEEVVVNIVNYAYPDETGVVRMECSSDDEKFIVTISDEGVSFDMSLQTPPDITSSAAERGIGGLGIFLVKELMDEVEYRRENDTNILVLGKKL